MKWTKRLKWTRLSKIVIPITLAISLVFAGFSVYANEAENFVLHIKNAADVNLSITLDRDLQNLSSMLLVTVNGHYDNTTYTPDTHYLYNSDGYYDGEEKDENNVYYYDGCYNDGLSKSAIANLPDDIAKHEGIHTIYQGDGLIAFYSFSFYLVNTSSRAVDVDYKLTIDGLTHGKNADDRHIEGAVRVMFIEDEPLLSDLTYTIYKMPEKTEANENYCLNAKYTKTEEMRRRIQYFDEENSMCVFNRLAKDGTGLVDFAPYDPNDPERKGVRRFTVVLWLEGWDYECHDEILGETMKMSLTFEAH